MYTKLIATLGCAALMVQPAAAQSVPTPLQILIEEADEDSLACGVTNNLMRSSLREALRDNTIAEASSDGYGQSLAYLSVTTMRQGDLCISSADFTIKKYDYAEAPGMVDRVYADVVFCSNGTMLTGDDHGARVAQKIKDLVDGCLNDMMLED